jgi:hypothetical protein
VTLDERPPLVEHAALRESWRDMAHRQRTEDQARDEAEWRDRELAEGEEATHAHWFGHEGKGGAFREMPWHVRAQRWDTA